MTKHLHTHHLAIGALLGLLVALFVPAALVVVLAGTALVVGFKLSRHQSLATVRR